MVTFIDTKETYFVYPTSKYNGSTCYIFEKIVSEKSSNKDNYFQKGKTFKICNGFQI